MIYLDYNASTPTDERVLEKMLPFFNQHFGNASSNTHAWGWLAKEAIENSRQQIAQSINCEAEEVIFTSGATEAANIVIAGIFNQFKNQKNEILVNQTEHKAVLETCLSLEKQGAKIILIPVDRTGIVDVDFIKRNISQKTSMVCVMHANSETGTIQPIDIIGKICEESKTVFICDASQSFGKVMLDVKENHIGALLISSHKIYGPKGAGAIYLSRKNPRIKFDVNLFGGSQENGIRPGSHNVPSIVGFGYAAEISQEMLWDDATRLSRLRTIFEQHLCEMGRFHINGNIRNRLPNTTNITFNGIKASDLLLKLPTLGMSFGSACSSDSQKPSHVLKAMGLSDEACYSSIRISLGRNTSEENIWEVFKLFSEVF